MVLERLDHIQKWEAQRGHEYEWIDGEEEIVRDQRVQGADLICRYDN